MMPLPKPPMTVGLTLLDQHNNRHLVAGTHPIFRYFVDEHGNPVDVWWRMDYTHLPTLIWALAHAMKPGEA